MTSRDNTGMQRPRDLENALNRLDLAQETLEGLDELGVTTRDELVALMNALEAEIGDDAEPPS
jgi:BMFP domain-containing protein YqiC